MYLIYSLRIGTDFEFSQCQIDKRKTSAKLTALLLTILTKPVLVKALVFSTLCLMNTAHAASGHCKFIKLEVRSAKPDDFSLYHASTQNLRLDFINPEPQRPTDLFPEPPLRVTSSNPKRHCDIDGGIWRKDHVYLSHDETVLALLEYSGSNSWLAFYSTDSCKSLMQIELHGQWQLNDEQLIDQGRCACTDSESPCACWPAALYKFDSRCRPIRLKKESRQLSKQTFGVPFDRPSLIARPKTKQARIIREINK